MWWGRSDGRRDGGRRERYYIHVSLLLGLPRYAHAWGKIEKPGKSPGLKYHMR